MGGLTKSSDRYAKWFGSRVPSVSRGFIVILVLLCALPFSSIIYLGFGFTILGINWWIALPITVLTGALFHVLYLLILKIRFNNPSSNSEFHDLIGRIHQKVVISSKIHVWVRQSDDVFITSIYNPIFNAVIVSEPMVDLIMKSPESGEALLAFHFIRIPSTRWFADLVGAIILFLIITYTSSLVLIPFALMITPSIAYLGIFFITLVSSFGTIFTLLALFILIVKGAFWRHEPAFLVVQELYGLHPNVAKVQVERGIVLTGDEAQAVVWSVRDWEKKKRGSRRAGVSVLIAVASWFFAFVSFGWGVYIPYNPYFYLMMNLPYLIAGLAALISYLLIRRWDKNAMGEVFKETTDYDEPIWVD